MSSTDPNPDSLLLDEALSLELAAAPQKRRGRKPGQTVPKGAELSDQQVIQKLLSLGKRANRTPQQLLHLLSQYLDKYQQVLELRRQADELEQQLQVGFSGDLSDAASGLEEDEDDLDLHR